VRYSAAATRVNTPALLRVHGHPGGVFGAAGSGAVLAAAAGWWLRGSRAALLAAYLLGLASLPVLAYLTYLELFVIGAICIWCVAYALTVIGGWLAMLALRLRRSTAG
jgi:uncharacterized membrane protein